LVGEPDEIDGLEVEEFGVGCVEAELGDLAGELVGFCFGAEVGDWFADCDSIGFEAGALVGPGVGCQSFAEFEGNLEKNVGNSVGLSVGLKEERVELK